MKSNVTLRIKRVYFDQILNGSKKVEYRAVKPFYERLFRDVSSIKTLTLHYQQERKLIADIVSIKRMPLPKEFDNDPDRFDFGNECFAIRVKNVRLIRGRK